MLRPVGRASGMCFDLFIYLFIYLLIYLFIHNFGCKYSILTSNFNAHVIIIRVISDIHANYFR